MDEGQSFFYIRANNEVGRIKIGEKLLIARESSPECGSIVLTAPDMGLEIMNGSQNGRILGVVKNSFIMY